MASTAGTGISGECRMFPALKIGTMAQTELPSLNESVDTEFDPMDERENIPMKRTTWLVGSAALATSLSVGTLGAQAPAPDPRPYFVGNAVGLPVIPTP